MRYAIIGGDERSACLARQLLAQGHRVHSYALEKARLPITSSWAGKRICLMVWLS